MQNAGFEALGLDWRYMAFDVDPRHLGDAIAGARRMGFVGLNLTVPHKVDAMQMVDVIDPEARDWGAINTIRFEGRSGEEWKPVWEFDSAPQQTRSHGFNTDVDAIARSIREDLRIELRGTKILLLGAGGAGRAAALKLASEGVDELYLVNRTESKAFEIMTEIRRRYPSVKVATGYPAGKVDLAVNATSLGLRSDDPLPIDLKQISFEKIGRVYDMIYRPVQTRFLGVAKEQGCPVANGLGMLLYQGAAALELWTGQKAPAEAMRAALEKEIYG